MLYFVESENVAVRDIKLVNAPYWSCFCHGCTHVFVRGANIHTLRTPFTHNGDGIDIDCCQFVTISDCHINTADDCITLRANQERLKHPQPCKYVTVSNCILSTPSNCIRIGVGDGEISDAVFSNLIVQDARTAFNFFSGWTAGKRGVDIANLRFDSVSVDCQDLLRIQYGRANGTTIRNLSFSGITGTVRGTSFLFGKAGNPLKNVQLSNVSLDLSGQDSFMKAACIDGMVLHDINIRGKSPTIGVHDVTPLEQDHCKPEPQDVPDDDIQKLQQRLY